MPVVLQSYAVLLSRPGDANLYAEIASETIEEINRQHSRSTGIHFHPLDWAKDSYADSGAEPQQLLNRQIVNKADIVLAIFKERMGTPTQRFDSGTEEEIMLALEAGKPVHAYFWQPPKEFIPADSVQYERLESFKSRISVSLIYATFSDEQELREKVTHDFTKRMFELEDDKPVRKPTLDLTTIGLDGKPTHQPAPQPTTLNSRYNSSALVNSVRAAFEKVSVIELSKPQPQETPHAESDSPLSSTVAKIRVQMPTYRYSEALLGSIEVVKVNESDRALVISVLEEIGIDVPQDLFYVGELRRNKLLTSSFPPGDDLQGTETEKAKYRALLELVSRCKSHVEYGQYLRSMESFVGLPLLIENNGSAPATHVVAEVFVPKSLFIPVTDIPMPVNDFIGRDLDDADMIAAFAKLPFEISESYRYRSYEDSRVRTESVASIPPMHTRVSEAFPFYGQPVLDQDDYRKEVEYIFEDFSFKTAPDEDIVAVSTSFDRVQQNASYAFPVLLPLRSSVYSLRYRINADELDEPIEGKIEFETGA